MTDTPSKDLARDFFDFHRLAFERVGGAIASATRWFDFTPEQFDDWAAAAGYMTNPVRDGNTVVERRGLAAARSELRGRLNRAARKGDGVPRAFSVEARGGRWRVVLIERFLEEQPHEIIDALSKMHDHALRRVTGLKAQADEAEHLSDAERTLIKARLE